MLVFLGSSTAIQASNLPCTPWASPVPPKCIFGVVDPFPTHSSAIMAYPEQALTHQGNTPSIRSPFGFFLARWAPFWTLSCTFWPPCGIPGLCRPLQVPVSPLGSGPHGPSLNIAPVPHSTPQRTRAAGTGKGWLQKLNWANWPDPCCPQELNWAN